VQNLARFLQTPDADGNPDDGVNIPEQAHDSTSAVVMTVDFSSATFETDIAQYVTNVHDNGGATNSTLVLEESATAKLQSQLASFVGSWSAATGTTDAPPSYFSPIAGTGLVPAPFGRPEELEIHGNIKAAITT
jgi:hypothetical protein